MGDRAVFGFRDSVDSPTIYLYSHWGGASQRVDLIRAVGKARPRWSDAAYATRICISELVGTDWSQELGFGVSVGTFCEPDYETMQVVTWDDQTVSLMLTRSPHDEIQKVSFAEFENTADRFDEPALFYDEEVEA